jgi:hypothetical protein
MKEGRKPDNNCEVLALFVGIWGSSASIASDYRVDDQGLISDRGKGFLL